MSSPLYEDDHGFRYFMKTVIENLPTIYSQFSKEFPPVAAEDLGIVPDTLLQNFIRALFFEYHVGRQWGIMWNQYYQDMAYSNRNYVLMVLYSCLKVYRGKEPFYERFLDIFGLVAGASHAFSFDMDYHEYAAPILMVFFDSFLEGGFYKAGGWHGLEEYLKGLNYLDWYFVRADLKYRDIRKRFNSEVAWWRSTKSYHKGIRLISTVDAFPNEICNRMANKVLTMDTAVCDHPDEVTVESVLSNARISTVRKSLQEWNKPLRVDLQEREIVEHEVIANEIARDLAKLRKQGDFESIMLRAAGTLIEEIKNKLLEAEKVSDTLKRLYLHPIKQ